jgi:hypothetical protein
MTPTLNEIFAGGSWFQITALLWGALFFAVVGTREVRHGFAEGYLYLTLGIFFAVAHAVVTVNALDNGLLPGIGHLNLWTWLVGLFAPVLIALFCLRGLTSLVLLERREGLFRVFFGLTLLCYLYMLGSHWPIDVRAILARFPSQDGTGRG